MANTSDVMQSLRRIWAFLKQKDESERNRFFALPGLLENPHSRWNWRLNIYYDLNFMILAHVFDP